MEDLLARQQTTLNAVCGEVGRLQVTQEEFARLVGQRETGVAGGVAREGGARSGETPAEQVVAAIRALDATQPSGLKWTKEHKVHRTRAWAVAGLLKGPLGVCYISFYNDQSLLCFLKEDNTVSHLGGAQDRGPKRESRPALGPQKTILAT